MTANVKLRVFLVEDHQIVREGLRALIEAQPQLSVIGEASDGASAIEQVIQLRPDVVVMDISMPRMGGTEATAKIKQTCPEVSVLALTAHEDGAYVKRLLAAGASGYVLKRAAAADLVRAIHAVAAHGLYLDPAIASLAVAKAGRRNSGRRQPAPGALSDRERDVLRMIAQGHSMKTIADALDISARTLETYKARAMDKLELSNRSDIVRYALQQGWL